MLFDIVNGLTNTFRDLQDFKFSGYPKHFLSEVEYLLILNLNILISDHDGNSIKREKSIWWMPWRIEAMKDVVGCDKPRGVVNRL